MLRLTDVQLPLDHPESDIRTAILSLLDIGPDRLTGYSVFRRGYDARRKSAIVLVYTLDVEVVDEAAVLERLRGNRQVAPTPDTSVPPTYASPDIEVAPVWTGSGASTMLEREPHSLVVEPPAAVPVAVAQTRKSTSSSVRTYGPGPTAPSIGSQSWIWSLSQRYQR